MRAFLAVIVTIIFPGTGHLLYRRYLKGAVLAMLFAAAADVFLVSMFLLPLGKEGTLPSMTGLSPYSTGPSVREAAPLFPLVAPAIMAGVWLFAIIDLVLRLKSLRASDFQKTKDDLLKAAQVAWLRDEYPEAERLLRQILRMDERDVEAWVHLGKILKSCGRENEARTCFRSALNLDGSEPWRWQLLTEL